MDSVLHNRQGTVEYDLFLLIRLNNTSNYSLATLRDELTRDNYSKISFLIVNTFQSSSNNRLDAFRSVTSIDVYQDTEMEKVWESYNASKDDMLIFDR